MAVTRTLGGVTLPKPIQWDESYSVIENTNTSEAGTDLVNLVRQNKLSVSCSFNCSTRLYHSLYSLSQQTSLTLQTYDPLLDTTGNRTVRMRDFSASFQQYSDNVPNTTGLWVVSFNLTEF